MDRNLPVAMGAASGAILTELLDLLVEKKILSRAEVATLLGDAQRSLGGTGNQDLAAAARAVSSLYTKYV